ncbi:Olfactory receptor 51F2 [Heterocephalus glaber]|uniref:Olfactory receptor 51F2 n=1 Tax=Heterocephalus glaber TaxID=10181 RepID=G5B999_HETGA|nr:Olfactory receptor 51F2 [Heterocephalus glaber]
MATFQNITSSPVIFLLTGVPGLEAFHTWISIPFCLLYATAVSGNSLILFVIITQPSLHEPMYYFLSMLSTTDLGLSISTLATMLGIFWFNVREISFNACLSQMFFIQLFTVMESSVLLAMAFDRFVAISNPLRTVLSIASPEERKKAFSTCISHIGAVAVFYIPLISLSFVHRFGKRTPPYMHTLIASAYLLFPPVMNPIIYSVKIKQIQMAVLKVLYSSTTKT